MSVKEMPGGGIETQKEAMVTLTDFDEGVALLKALGCKEKAYQETRRELWMLDGVEVTIDEWPFLDLMVEIEGKNEAEVRAAAEKLGFEWSEAKFTAAGAMYVEKYGKSEEQVANGTPRIVFDEPNPFV
jgi:adenylate cyclase class 2